MQQSEQKKIFHLPRWYPHELDPQQGVFIEKHIKASSGWFDHSVLFAYSKKGVKEPKTELTNQNNVLTVKLRYPKSSNIFRNLYRYIKNFRLGFKLLVKEKGKPDLIHVHVLLRTGLLGWFYAKRLGIPYVVTEHWSGYLTGAFEQKPFLYRKASLFVLKHAAKITVVSSAIKTEMTLKGIPEEKIEIIPNVVECSPKETTKPAKDKKIIMLSVADLVDDIKKISDVIKVLAEIKKAPPFEYRIIGDGPDRKKLETLAESKGLLNTKVFFLGRKTNHEVLDYLQKCSFLIMNSATETFSVVTAEALLSGKPVVATRCGGPEQFVNLSNGILINPGHPEELKKAIEKMMVTFKDYDPERLKNSVADRFSTSKIGLQFKKIYDKVLSENRTD